MILTVCEDGPGLRGADSACDACGGNSPCPALDPQHTLRQAHPKQAAAGTDGSLCWLPQSAGAHGSRRSTAAPSSQRSASGAGYPSEPSCGSLRRECDLRSSGWARAPGPHDASDARVAASFDRWVCLAKRLASCPRSFAHTPSWRRILWCFYLCELWWTRRPVPKDVIWIWRHVKRGTRALSLGKLDAWMVGPPCTLRLVDPGKVILFILSLVLYLPLPSLLSIFPIPLPYTSHLLFYLSAAALVERSIAGYSPSAIPPLHLIIPAHRNRNCILQPAYCFPTSVLFCFIP